MSGLFYLIVLGLIATLALAVWGFTTTVIGRTEQRQLAARASLSESERQASTPIALFDAWLRRTDLGRAVSKRILASGVKIRVSTLLFLVVITGLVVLIFVGEFLGILFGIAGAVGVGGLFFAYLRRQEERRREEFIKQLPELARVLSNATSAGLAIRTSIGMAADELSEPAGSELRRAADALAFGQSLDDAMNDLQERLPSRELQVLVSTLVVSSRSGGSLVTALRTISNTLEERKETRREAQTIMGEAVSTSWAMIFLSIGSLFLLNIVQPGSIKHMTEVLPGQIMLVVAMGLFVSGILIIRRMTRIDI